MHAAGDLSRSTTLVLALGVSFCSAAVVPAAEWPGWRGPERNAISPETGLLQSWPQGGPRLVWQIKTAGEGYSGPAVARGFLVTMGNRDEDEYVLCYSVNDGRELWAYKNGKAYKNSYGNGPRCTPTIDGNRVFALGANGDLCCLDLRTGKAFWQMNILQRFRGNNIGWGISESPLIEGNLVIVTPGGTEGTLVALDKFTGTLRWASKDPSRDREPAGYASPIAFTVGGVRQIATFTSLGAFAARASDGKFLWRYDKVANRTANIATPVFFRDHIFYSSAYGAGCALLKLSSDGQANEVYFSKDLQNHHGGFVLVDGYLYGYNGGSALVCMEWSTGKLMWRDRSVGKASLCYADRHLYVLSEDGVVGLVEANPKQYREKGRFKLPVRSDRHSWPHPIIADGRLYIRDQQYIHCFDVRSTAAARIGLPLFERHERRE